MSLSVRAWSDAEPPPAESESVRLRGGVVRVYAEFWVRAVRELYRYWNPPWR